MSCSNRGRSPRPIRCQPSPCPSGKPSTSTSAGAGPPSSGHAGTAPSTRPTHRSHLRLHRGRPRPTTASPSRSRRTSGCSPAAGRWRSPAWPAASPDSCAAPCWWPRSASPPSATRTTRATTCPTWSTNCCWVACCRACSIPLLVHAQVEDDDEGMAYTQRLLSIAAVALGVMTVIAVAAAPLIAGFFVAPGAQRHLTTEFATLLLPEIFFYGLGALFTAVLNVRHVYGPGAWAPVLNNVIMIVTIVIFWVMPGPDDLNLATITTAQVLVLGIGTTLGIAAPGAGAHPVPAAGRASGGNGDSARVPTRSAGCARSARWPVGCSATSSRARSASRSSRRSVWRSAGSASSPRSTCCSRCPTGSSSSRCSPRSCRGSRARPSSGDNDAVIADLSLGARMSAIALVPITVGLMALGVPLAITLFALRADLGGRRRADRLGTCLVGVRVAAVRARHAAAARVLRHARRSHADADQRLHGRDEDRAGAADQFALRRPAGHQRERAPAGARRGVAQHQHLGLLRDRRDRGPRPAHASARAGWVSVPSP